MARALTRHPSRRYRPARRGPRVDLRTSMRGWLRAGSEPLRLLRRARKPHPGRVIVLCDVSGSMEPYSHHLLRFVHALDKFLPRRVEAFAFSTSYLRLTPFLRAGDADAAFRRAVAAAADWGGGTRIGECLDHWYREYGSSLCRRRSTVIILSDGLDMGDPEVLRRALGRIRRATGRVVWLNPLAGDPRYRPLARGMRAALPFVDALLSAHDLESLALLGRLLAARAGTLPAPRQAAPSAALEVQDADENASTTGIADAGPDALAATWRFSAAGTGGRTRGGGSGSTFRSNAEIHHCRHLVGMRSPRQL
ncbi:VWA domain-containing protein [Thermaerobacter sp. PB12/4term]|uniref:vWA domain-containing protein n=1 Tax=Thermaerobacter sp. PB12/4term TaxID=2293838 RepID=UPI000E329E0C|nr:VWA domain-containing protein [Thermaerobacter sp. PB12/4term]QIA27711.1 VWA domain-containing protein [Thermaerobacter sp. PB12/4term]